MLSDTTAKYPRVQPPFLPARTQKERGIPTALAAGSQSSRIGSRWTNVLGRSITGRPCTAVNCNPGLSAWEVERLRLSRSTDLATPMVLS